MKKSFNTCNIAPALCRALAKATDKQTGEQRLATDHELMQRTGWGKKHLRSVYQRTSWDEVASRDIDTFTAACGITPKNQRRHVWTLERIRKKGGDIRMLRHLRPCKGWRENQILTLVKMLERVGNESGNRIAA